MTNLYYSSSCVYQIYLTQNLTKILVYQVMCIRYKLRNFLHFNFKISE